MISATNTLLLASLITLCHSYCWQPGKNPNFSSAPTVTQIDIRTVDVSWANRVVSRECADNFLVKYWPKSAPNEYHVTDLISNEADSVRIELTPKVKYVFQAVAREDKGLVGGVDWNKSPTVEFRTTSKAYSNLSVKNYEERVNRGGGGISSTESTPVDSVSEESSKFEGKKVLGFKIEFFIGIVVGALLFILAAVGICYKCAKRGKKKKFDLEDQDEDDDEEDVDEGIEEEECEKEDLAPDKNAS